MSHWKHRAIIVAPITDRKPVNDAVKDSLDRLGGQNTLTVGLSNTGNAPATHYWCCTALTNDGRDGLKGLAPAFPGSKAFVWSEPANADVDAVLETELGNQPNVTVGHMTPDEVLADQGLKVIHAEVA